MATPTLEACLYKNAGAPLFAVLDGASVEGLPDKLAAETPNHCCLYRGELEPDLAEVAPYLIELPMGGSFAKWVIELGWDHHWGIFVEGRPTTSLEALRHHFRTLAQVRGPEGQRWLFRYYDPRVLRTFLPTCERGQVAAMFGSGVVRFVCEDKTPGTALSFEVDAANGLARVTPYLLGPAAPGT